MYPIEGRSDYRYFLYALNCRLQGVCLVFIIMKQKKESLIATLPCVIFLICRFLFSTYLNISL